MEDNCSASFYLAYINLSLYGLMTLVVLWNNWDKYGYGILLLFLAPFYSILVTAYFVSYEWWMQGNRITCVAFGSHTEMVTRDFEGSLIFLVQVIFIFTMLKILRKINSPNEQEATKVQQDVTRKMIALIVIFLAWSLCVTVLKYMIFRRPTFDEQKFFAGFEIYLLVISGFRIFLNMTLMVVFYKVISIYKKQVAGVASSRHMRWMTFF
jgi:hypothetical protein